MRILNSVNRSNRLVIVPKSKSKSKLNKIVVLTSEAFRIVLIINMKVGFARVSCVPFNVKQQKII